MSSIIDGPFQPSLLFLLRLELVNTIGMSNAVVVCMLTLTSYYNVVLHHFVNIALCDGRCKLHTPHSLLQSVSMCADCTVHNHCMCCPLHSVEFIVQHPSHFLQLCVSLCHY